MKDGQVDSTLDIRQRAEWVRNNRPGTVIIDSSGGPSAIDCDISLPDGTPIGHMIVEATLSIRAGELNRMAMVLHTPSVIAQVMDYQFALDMEANLSELRQYINNIMRVDSEEQGMADSEGRALLDMLDEQVKLAKAMMHTPKQVLHGKTLRQWCAQFGIDDEATIERAADINETEPHGLRVFPDGTAWMAVAPDDDERTGHHARVAFGDTPGGAVINWAKEFDTDEGSEARNDEQQLTRDELVQALNEITQHRCITLLPAEQADHVDVLKEGNMASPVLAGVWRAEVTPTYARWWKSATHPDWLPQVGQHGLPQKYTDVQPLNEAAQVVAGDRGPEAGGQQ